MAKTVSSLVLLFITMIISDESSAKIITYDDLMSNDQLRADWEAQFKSMEANGYELLDASIDMPMDSSNIKTEIPMEKEDGKDRKN